MRRYQRAETGQRLDQAEGGKKSVDENDLCQEKAKKNHDFWKHGGHDILPHILRSHSLSPLSHLYSRDGGPSGGHPCDSVGAAPRRRRKEGDAGVAGGGHGVVAKGTERELGLRGDGAKV